MSFLKNNFFKYLYLKDQKYLIILVGVTLIVSALCGFAIPQLIKNLYDSYKVGGDTHHAILMLSIIFIAEYFISLIYQVSINRYVQKLLGFIRSRSYREWMLSIERRTGDRDKYPMGEVLSRILTDTEAVIEMVNTGSFKILIDFTFIISCLVGFINLNTISGMALIFAEVSAVVILILGSKNMAVVYMEVRKSTGIMSRVIANLVGGFRFSFYHPHNAYASQKGEASFEDFLRKQLKANVWDATYFSIAESLFPILLALVVIIFPYSHITEIAVIAAIVDLIQRSIAPIKEAAGKISSIQRARTGIIRIEEFYNDLHKLPKSHYDIKEELIHLKHLSMSIDKFEYPKTKDGNTFRLEGISFEANPGELIGIVGKSGCGKSTLLKILATDIVTEGASVKIVTTDNKEILFSGKNIENLLLYRRQVSIVSQDSHVFSSTLRFNITMGSESSQIDDSLNEFWNRVNDEIPYIKKWGISIDSHIEPKELSLGQKQLISALRSCYLAKPIVLFDEISSGLDSDLELALRNLVLMIQKKSLTFIVAHRIETIISAQKILVMDKGKLIAQGSHSELLTHDELYRDLIAQIKKANI